MKVFFVNTNRQWGGGEKWHFDTAQALMRKGHEVSILSGKNFELFKKAIQSGLRAIPVNISNLSFLNPFAVLKIAGIFRKEKPDAVILNFSSDLKTAGLAASIAGIPRIIYRRGNAKPVKNSMLNRFLFRKIITGVIANSEETKRTILLHNNRLIPSEKIRVFYNGINLEDYRSTATDNLYQKKANEVIIGSAGRLSDEKGHSLLLEAAMELKKTCEHFTILIAGTGPSEASLKKMIMVQHLDGNIKMLGFVSNIKTFMETIDIFVLPSRWEGFGYVTIEAMAASKPVIAFRTGSNPEIIVHESTGILVDNFNTKELAQAIGALIDNVDLRKKMGVAGRKRVEKLFDIKVIQHQIEEFLSEK